MTAKGKWKKILLVICDQWRFRQHWPEKDALPLPTYAKLCDNGVEYTHACIASAACSPSRACLVSGKYSRETGTTSTSGFTITPGEGDEIQLGYPFDDSGCPLPRTSRPTTPRSGDTVCRTWSRSSRPRASSASGRARGTSPTPRATGPWAVPRG